MLSPQHIQAIADSKKLFLNNPKPFFTEILNEELDPWQLVCIEAIADVHRHLNGLPTVVNHKGLNRISIHSCHGPGKTHFLAQVIHWWNYVFYGLVVATAPKENQIKRRLFPRYRKILKHADVNYAALIKADLLSIAIRDVNPRTGNLELDYDWGCVGETASDPDNMSGYHDEPQLIVVDEASAKRLDPMFPVLEGTLTTPGSVLVQIGNPTRTEGEFFEAHNRLLVSRLFFQMHLVPACVINEFKSTKHKIVMGSERVSEEWVNNMIQKYGRSSPVVKIRVFGMFAETEVNQLIALQWLEDARDIDEVTDGSIPKLRILIDVADGGLDFSVITVVHVYETFIQYVKQTQYSYPPSVAPTRLGRRAIRTFKEYGGNKDVDDFVVDGVGVGAGTAGTILDEGYKVRVHKGGSTKGVNTNKYRNQRTQSYCKYRDAHRDGKVKYSPDFTDDWEEYIAQACSIKTNPGSERIDDIETKQSMISRNVKSPDRSDSASFAFAPTGTTVSNNITSLNEQFSDLMTDDI